MRKFISKVLVGLVCMILLSSCGGPSPSPSTNNLADVSVEEGQGSGNSTPMSYGTEVGAYKGVSAYSNGDTHNTHSNDYHDYGHEWQCVEYVNRFLVLAKGYKNLKGSGNAKAYWTGDVGLQKIPNNQTGCPQQDDVIVSTYGSTGHVAIVKEITSDSIFVIQQNWDNNYNDGSFRLAYDYDGVKCNVKPFAGGKYYVDGWLRVADNQTNVSLPSLPNGLTATYNSSNNSNYLTWNSVAGATSYKVFWGTSSGVTTGSNSLIPTSTASYAHSGVQGGYTYFYRIQAINSAGSSNLSNEVSVTVPNAVTIPSAPIIITSAYQSANSLNYLAWNPSIGATSYKVYWSTSPGVTTSSSSLTPTSTTDYGHSGVQAGYTYYYRVQAINSAGASSLSSEVSVTIPSSITTPSTPTGISGVYQSSNSWNYITWNSVVGATAYKVYWSTSPGVTTSSSYLTPTSTTDYGHSGVQGGYTYYYRVQASNSAGTSSLSSEVSVTVPSLITIPSAPAGISGVYQSSNSWNYITWNSVAGATTYKVYWSTSPGVTTSSSFLSSTSTTDYGHSGVQGGYTYYYRVQAINSAGISGLSNEASVTVPISITSATVYNFNSNALTFSSGITSWNNVVVVVRGSNLSSTSVVNVPGLSCNSSAPLTSANFSKIPFSTSGAASYSSISGSAKTTYPAIEGYSFGFASVCIGGQLTVGTTLSIGIANVSGASPYYSFNALVH